MHAASRGSASRSRHGCCLAARLGRRPATSSRPARFRHDRLALICPHVSPVLEALRPTAAVKAQVYIEYRIYHHVYGQYEVDHLVPVELDGADTKANLWPEPGQSAGFERSAYITASARAR